jgi:site-specific recombinase XerD
MAESEASIVNDLETIASARSQVKRTRITASAHSLRHTFATRLYHKTGDLHLVQRAPGHRQITTTEVYARISDDSIRHAIGRL